LDGIKNIVNSSADWHTRYAQQAAWTRDLRAYLFERAGLAASQRILEVGCGTGVILSELAGSAALHALDLDPAALTQCRLHAPRAQRVRANGQALPYPAAVFDITFCHFFLLWAHDPLQALIEMKRVTRPGGNILALAEPDHTARVDEPPTLRPLGRWQTEALRRRGANVGFGARLAETFFQAGIPLIETGTIQRGEDISATGERELEWDLLEADLAESVTYTDLQKLKRLDQQAWAAGTRALHVPTYFAWGRA
jgi:ubiquinone/menaquinone biosynthesis C-methylase UbiE